MRRMATADRRGREVAWFEDGDLWCSDEAVPPSNPAGWYFRPRGATQQPWIGPFRSDEAAETSAYSGDALRDARRRLEAWAASVDDEADEESVDDGRQDAVAVEVPQIALRVVEPVEVAVTTEPVSVESPVTALGQLDLGFEQTDMAAALRSSRRGSRRFHGPSVEQIELPL